jgi:hypothetical protein
MLIYVHPFYEEVTTWSRYIKVKVGHFLFSPPKIS